MIEFIFQNALLLVTSLYIVHLIIFTPYIVWKFRQWRAERIELEKFIYYFILGLIPLVALGFYLQDAREIKKMWKNKKQTPSKRKDETEHFKVLMKQKETALEYKRELWAGQSEMPIEKTFKKLEDNLNVHLVQWLIVENKEPFEYLNKLIKEAPELLQNPCGETATKVKKIFDEYQRSADSLCEQLIAEKQEIELKLRNETEKRVEKELEEYINQYKKKATQI